MMQTERHNHHDEFCTVKTIAGKSKLGVHRNRYCKIRLEPELVGTDKKFRRELPTGTGTDFINRSRVNTLQLYKSSMF